MNRSKKSELVLFWGGQLSSESNMKNLRLAANVLGKSPALVELQGRKKSVFQVDICHNITVTSMLFEALKKCRGSKRKRGFHASMTSDFVGVFF